jgi:hypothetical protein
MMQIAQLESRITKALDRIERGLEAHSKASGLMDEASAASSESDAVAALEGKLETAAHIARNDAQAAQETIQELTLQLDAQGRELQRQSAQVTTLRAHITMMRAQISQGTVDGYLINQSMAEELAALEVERNKDRLELTQIVAALQPILNSEVPNA